MYRNARLRVGLSMEEASHRLNIGTRTLYNYETGTLVPAETALNMSRVYDNSFLVAKHCRNQCPIGQILAHEVEETDMPTTYLMLFKGLKDVNKLAETLLDIVCDGVVDHGERDEYNAIQIELNKLEKTLFKARILATRLYPVQKERQPKMAAR